MSYGADSAAVKNELERWRADARFKRPHWYSSDRVIVPNNSPSLSTGTGASVSSIKIKNAHFRVKAITGYGYGPCNSSGVAQTGATTDFPNPLANAFAVRGLSVQIKDNFGHLLSNNPIPLELFAAPGYGHQIFVPLELPWLLEKDTELQLEWRNADTKTADAGATQLYHAGYLVLVGENYHGSL